MVQHVKCDKNSTKRGEYSTRVVYRGEETPVRTPKLCTDHDIKPFICGLVMCILLGVVCHAIFVLLSYSSVYI